MLFELPNFISCKNEKNLATKSIAIHLENYFFKEIPVDDSLQSTIMDLGG